MRYRKIAIYLPQFHPNPENDVWWGKGFTEWTNVTKCRPLFNGHIQPKLPTDLGFYDLRLEESRYAQEQLAKEYGIYGFCYYHYWFKGKRLLNIPLDLKLKNKNQDLPFLLCWANETWSRRWLGEEKEILIKQEYSFDDDHAHAEWLFENVFQDDRYVKINNRPVFIIYRPAELPDYMKTIEVIKSVAISRGMPEPYIIGSNSHTQNLSGFDKILNFEPKLGLLPDAFEDSKSYKKILRNFCSGVLSASLKIYDYNEVKRIMSEVPFTNQMLPCVFVGWDNSPRRESKSIIIINQNRDTFKKSLLHAKNLIKDYSNDEKIIFINAWNEWAEGNYLEPDRLNGHTYLEAIKEVFND